MEIKKGDIIYVTDEDLKGTVTDIKNNDVLFICEDGFEYCFPIHSVFKIGEQGEVIHRNKTFQPMAFKVKRSKDELTSLPIFFDVKNAIFDLHLEKLNPEKSFLSEHESLLYQLETVREIIATANRKRVRKITLIHGVGKGKLRREIRNLLDDSYPEIEYLDGDYQKYGGGATELIIHQFDSIY